MIPGPGDWLARVSRCGSEAIGGGVDSCPPPSSSHPQLN